MDTLKKYDFYYSLECENSFRRDVIDKNKVYVITKFKGIKYTEMIESGKKPMTSWAKDLEKIGTGYISDITYETTKK